MNEKQNIGSLFDRIASRYDFLNHLFSLNIDRRWRRKAVGPLEHTDEVLDVACGTADLTIELLRQNKASKITGIDLSREMMRLGEKKLEQAHLTDRATLLYANAQEMPFETGQFGTVVCAFGVRNFANLDAGLREMYRVLQSNGQLMILEFSYPDNRLFRAVYDFYFRHIMPFIGRIVSGDKNAYTYFYQSVRHFVWGEEMLSHLRSAGFTTCKAKTLTFGIATIYTAEKR